MAESSPNQPTNGEGPTPQELDTHARKGANELLSILTNELQYQLKSGGAVSDANLERAQKLQVAINTALKLKDPRTLSNAVGRLKQLLDGNFPGAKERYDKRQAEIEKEKAEAKERAEEVAQAAASRPEEPEYGADVPRSTEVTGPSGKMNLTPEQIKELRDLKAQKLTAVQPAVPTPAESPASTIDPAVKEVERLEEAATDARIEAERLARKAEEAAAEAKKVADEAAAQPATPEPVLVPAPAEEVTARAVRNQMIVNGIAPPATDMELAFAKAGQLKGKIRNGRKARVKGKEETPRASTKTDPSESAKKAYLRLGRIVRDIGVKPEELGARAWDDANRALDKVTELTGKRAEAKSEEEIAALDEKIRRQTAGLVGKKMTKQLERIARAAKVARAKAEQPAPAAEPQAPAGAETPAPTPEPLPAVFRKNQRGPKSAGQQESAAPGKPETLIPPPTATSETAAMQSSMAELREKVAARIPPKAVEQGEGGGRENQIDHWRRLSEKLQRLYPDGLPAEVANEWGKLNAEHSTAVLAKDTKEVSRVLSLIDSFVAEQKEAVESAAASEAKPEARQLRAPEASPEEKFQRQREEVARMFAGEDFNDKYWGGLNPLARADVYATHYDHNRALKILEEAVKELKSKDSAEKAKKSREKKLEKEPAAPAAGGGEEQSAVNILAAQALAQEEAEKPTAPEVADAPAGEGSAADLFRERAGAQAAGAPEKPTAAESRGILKSLIDGYKWTRERFTKSKDYLNNRAKEIDAKAEVGGLEKVTRRFGELYNKLSLTHKLGIGVLLGVGTAVGSAVSLPLALAGLTGLVVQRAAGAASMFLQIEKTLQEKKVGESYQFMAQKERAAIDALLYTAVMGTAISEALKFVDKTETVQWWKQFFQENGDAAPVAKAPMKEFQAEVRAVDNAIPESRTTGFQAEVRAVDNATMAAAPTPVAEAILATQAEVPTAMVQATPGKGYEWMMKRLWEELQSQNLDPNRYAENSDIYKLLKADANSIDKVVHQIAADPERGFFKPDGTSVRINLGQIMTINTDGSIQLDDMVKAPPGAPTTGIFPPQPVIPTQGAPIGSPVFPGDHAFDQWLPQQTVESPGKIATVYTPTAEPPPIEPPPPARPLVPEGQVWKDSYGHEWQTTDGTRVTTTAAESVAAVQSGSAAPEQSVPEPEAQATPAPEEILRTRNGEIINSKVPAIYEVKSNGETYLFASGGTDAERLAFVQKYQEALARTGADVKPIRNASFVPSLLGGGETRMSEIGGKAQGGVFRDFLGFLSGQPKSPSPADFVRKVSP